MKVKENLIFLKKNFPSKKFAKIYKKYPYLIDISRIKGINWYRNWIFYKR